MVQKEAARPLQDNPTEVRLLPGPGFGSERALRAGTGSGRRCEHPLLAQQLRNSCIASRKIPQNFYRMSGAFLRTS